MFIIEIISLCLLILYAKNYFDLIFKLDSFL